MKEKEPYSRTTAYKNGLVRAAQKYAKKHLGPKEAPNLNSTAVYQSRALPNKEVPPEDVEFLH